MSRERFSHRTPIPYMPQKSGIIFHIHWSGHRMSLQLQTPAAHKIAERCQAFSEDMEVFRSLGLHQLWRELEFVPANVAIVTFVDPIFLAPIMKLIGFQVMSVKLDHV